MIHSAFTADAGVHLVMAVKTLKTTPPIRSLEEGVKGSTTLPRGDELGTHGVPINQAQKTLFIPVSDPS